MTTFDIGTVVHHLHYDYRGVIVEVDESCQADEAWYRKNRTQPDRNQPWYHVFVDGGHETYVAHSNLEEDTAGTPINHPHVTRVFPSFYKGKYHRQSLN